MGNESEGKGWRRNIWGTRVREKDREEIYGEREWGKRIEKKYMGNKEERTQL